MVAQPRNPRQYTALFGLALLAVAGWLAFGFAQSGEYGSGYSYVRLVFAALSLVLGMVVLYAAWRFPAGYRVPPDVDRNDKEAVRRSIADYKERKRGEG